MSLILALSGIIIALLAAFGPGVVFLIPRLNPAIWYRLDERRTIAIGLGILIIMISFVIDRTLIWPLFFIPVLIGLRVFLRPDRVIRALDTPRHLSPAEADLPPDNYVLTAEIDGIVRAWPMEVTIAHHLIHDQIGNIPVVAAW